MDRRQALAGLASVAVVGPSVAAIPVVERVRVGPAFTYEYLNILPDQVFRAAEYEIKQAPVVVWLSEDDWSQLG